MRDLTGFGKCDIQSFSEIGTIPFVLLSLIGVVQSWRALMNGPMKRVIVMAFLTAAAFLMAILSKGVFAGVFLLCLAVVFIASCFASIKEKKYYWLRAIVYISVSLACVDRKSVV